MSDEFDYTPYEESGGDTMEGLTGLSYEYVPYEDNGGDYMNDPDFLAWLENMESEGWDYGPGNIADGVVDPVSGAFIDPMTGEVMAPNGQASLDDWTKNSTGSSGSLSLLNKLLSGNNLSNLINAGGALAGGYLAKNSMEDTVKELNAANNQNKDYFMKMAANIIPEFAMPSSGIMSAVTGKQLTNKDGSPLARAAGLQSNFASRPDVQQMMARHDLARKDPRDVAGYACGGKVGGMNAIKKDPVIHKYLGGYAGGGQADNILAAVSPNEYIFDAATVADLGDGNPDEGARKLDKMRENVRKHKRAAPANKIPPKAKSPEQYLKGKK